MGNNIPLHEYIGKVITAVPVNAYATDFLFGSDGTNDIPIDGMKGVLFIADHTPVAGATVDAVVYYASDGLSTNAGVDSDVWASTNARFAQFDSDVAAGCYLLNVDISSKGLTGGSLFMRADVVGADVRFGCIAIPYGGNMNLPSTNAQTVVNAD